ncbi:MAG: metalloregulator ArsR/SmtB family transcription factor [Pararhodobacter sp.]|nr:metalloregulator ArsR/SmtB family transcription factor [Pararhodobacter sp.]
MSISPKAALLEEFALVARALAAPARLMLLEQIAQGERGVEGLAVKTGLSIANTSQHLQHLRHAGLVVSRREGQSIRYRLSDDRALALMEMLGQVAARNLAQVADILRGLSDGEDAPEPVSRDDLAARLAEGSVTLLDLRPADEFGMAHIPGARNVALTELEHMAATIDPGTEIVAYCRGPYCVYAHQAVAALRKRGFNARRLDGGLPEWRAEKRPVTRINL